MNILTGSHRGFKFRGGSKWLPECVEIRDGRFQTEGVLNDDSLKMEKMEGSKSTSVLIGPISHDPTESVGAVNESFVAGLKGRVEFTLHNARRAKGATSAGSLNIGNGLVFMRHLASWLGCLVKTRPQIAHYAITSNWNMEKSLAMLGLAQVRGCRTVGHLHGGLFIEFWENAHPFRRRLAMYVIRRLDAFVVLSEGWKEKVVATLGLPMNQVRVVHNPIDGQFETAAILLDIGRLTDGFVLCFGVMDRKKGVFDILNAAAILASESKLKFVLVGPEREPGIAADVVNFIKDHGLEARVEWIGPVHGARKLELFRTASLFLLPSYVENFPVTVLESMAAGLPVICTAVGAVPEFLIDGESALIVNPGAADEIATAVQRLMEAPEERVRLATAAREVFQARLQRSQVMSQMMAVYEELNSANNFFPAISVTVNEIPPK